MVMLVRGTVVGDYAIESFLGRGGMGDVYEARQISLGRPVALKILRADLSEDEVFRRRFRKEGLIQAELDHPNIVAVHDAGEMEAGLFLAMRLVRGDTLKERIAAGLEPDRMLALLAPIGDALDTAHARGLIHRDVKPRNILVDQRGRPYLADFGLTKGIGDTTLTRKGDILGSMPYVSPEQILGRTVTPQTDVYSLGAVLYECLTGVRPYPLETEHAVLWAHVNVPPPSVVESRPDLPAVIDHVVAKAMAKAPEARYGSAGALIADAARALGGEAVDVTLPSPNGAAHTRVLRPATGTRSLRAPVVAETTARRRGAGRALLAGGLAAAALAAGAGYLVGHGGGPRDPATPPAPLTAAAATSDVAVRYPAGWQVRATVPSVPGLAWRSAVAFGPAAAAGGTVVVGTTTGGDASLLPSALRRRQRDLRTDDLVTLGRLQAIRYASLVTGDDRHLRLYVAPTDHGVVTVACVSSAAAMESLAGECERVARTARLTGGAQAYPLGASATLATALDGAVTRLNATRATARTTLVNARRPASQADAAQRLAQAYRRARSTLADDAVTPQAAAVHARLVRALGDAETAYDALATAARRGRTADYRAAARSVRTAEADVRRALAAFAPLGYVVA